MGPRRLIRLLAVVVVASVATACDEAERGTTSESSAPPGERAVVERINDGDTLTLRDGRQVRLVQIDTPELLTDCYGFDARAALGRLVRRGTTVVLVADPDLDRVDKYDRLLRYVYVGSQNVNLTLVRDGAASPYFFRKERGRYARELLAAVEDARRGRRGFWGACPTARLDPNRGSLTGPR